jgi:hypothetical protein
MTRECVFHSAPNTPSFPQSPERESTAHNIANICARNSQPSSFPQSFERESAARNTADVCARYRKPRHSRSLLSGNLQHVTLLTLAHAIENLVIPAVF